MSNGSGVRSDFCIYYSSYSVGLLVFSTELIIRFNLKFVLVTSIYLYIFSSKKKCIWTCFFIGSNNTAHWLEKPSSLWLFWAMWSFIKNVRLECHGRRMGVVMPKIYFQKFKILRLDTGKLSIKVYFMLQAKPKRNKKILCYTICWEAQRL